MMTIIKSHACVCGSLRMHRKRRLRCYTVACPLFVAALANCFCFFVIVLRAMYKFEFVYYPRHELLSNIEYMCIFMRVSIRFFILSIVDTVVMVAAFAFMLLSVFLLMIFFCCVCEQWALPFRIFLQLSRSLQQSNWFEMKCHTVNRTQIKSTNTLNA